MNNINKLIKISLMKLEEHFNYTKHNLTYNTGHIKWPSNLDKLNNHQKNNYIYLNNQYIKTSKKYQNLLFL